MVEWQSEKKSSNKYWEGHGQREHSEIVGVGLDIIVGTAAEFSMEASVRTVRQC